MMGNRFKSIDRLIELGETIFCVYFFIPYETTKAITYMKWKGFRTDLMYRLDSFSNETIIVFYQDEKFIPDLDTVDQFYKTVDENNIWEKANGLLNDYRYRIISDGVICISFIPIENVDAYQGTGKFKKE